ncbi:MAG: hypothetical protein ACR2MY_14755 [Candidatus Dormibacteria bacterium]
MAVKTTIRLPEALARRLRERSAEERRSFNDTAVRVLQAGLGETVAEDEWWRDLGDIVARPPLARFDREAMLQRRAESQIDISLEDARGLARALEDVREDRF